MAGSSSLFTAFVELAVRGRKVVEADIKVVEKAAKKLDGTTASVKVEERGSKSVIGALLGVQSKAEDIDKQRVTLNTELKGAGEVTSGLEAIKNRSDSLDRAKITLETSLQGAAGVIGELDSLEGVASRIDGDKVVLTAKVDGTEQGRAALASLEQAASKIDGDDLRMKAEVVGAANAVGELAAINSVADKVDGRDIRINIDSSSLDILGRINTGLGETASRIRAFGTVGAVAGLPAIIAAIAGIVPVASAAGVAVTALAGGIGRGLAGAAAIGGGALGALYAGFGLVLAPVKLLTKRFEDYEKGVGTLTTAQKGLYDSFKRFKPLLDTAFLPAQDQVARLGTQILKLAESYLPSLGKASLGVMQGLTRAFAGFSKQLSGPVEQAGITRLLTMLPKLMETAARAAGTFGLALFNVFARSLKFAQPLMNAINGVANRFLAFTESVSGQNQIDKWFATSAMRAKQLGTAILNLIRGFGGLFAALEASGATDRIMSGFVGMTRSFRQFTAEGSKGAASIQAFAKAAQPTIDAVWRLLKNLVGEWFRVSNAMFRARDEAGKLIVPAALDGIGKALRVIGDLLINTFTRFGPILGPLVAGIAGLLNAFIAHNPVLLALTRIVVGVLTAFRQLPMAIQSIIVSFASVASVLSVLGIGLGTVAAVGLGTFLPAIAALVAVAVGLGVAATVVRRNWSGIKQTFAPLAPVLQQVKSAMASVVPIVKNLGAVIKGLFTGNTGTEAFKKAFLSLPGPVQNAVKRIVIAWRGLKTSFSQAWAQIKPILTQIANGIKIGLGTAFKFLVSRAKAALAAFRAAWPGIKSAALPVIMAVANALRTVLGAAFRFALSQAKVIVNWFRANWPLIQRTVSTVMGILVARVKTGFNLLKAIIFPVVKAIVAFWKANWNSIRAILVAVWNIIKTTVQTAIKTVLNVIKLAMQVLTGDWRGAWQTIKNILRDAWNAMKSNVGNVLKIIGNIIKIAWTNIKAITLAAWNAVKNAIQDKIDAAQKFLLIRTNVMRLKLRSTWDSMRKSTLEAYNAIRDYINSKLDAARKFLLQHTNVMRLKLRSAWDSMMKSTLEAFNTIRDYIGDKLNTAKERATKILKNLGQAAFDRYELMKASAKRAFDAIRDSMVNPIESAYNGIKNWVGKILGVVNSVLKAVGLDQIKLGSSTESPGGNGSRGRGSMPARAVRFARGGMAREHRTNRFARGGLGTTGRQPRTHMWNEQLGNEAFIAEREPTATQLPYLQAAADWHDMAVVPANPSKAIGKRYRDFATGGIVAFAIGGETSASGQAMHTAVKNKFGVDGFNRHASYLSQPGASRSIDWFVTTPGTRAAGSQKTLGDNIAGYVAPPSTRAAVWYGRGNFGAGWTSNMNTKGIGNANTLGHYDHVHGEALAGGFKGDQGSYSGGPGGGGGGGGGFSVPNPLQLLFEKLWKSTVKPVADRFLNPLKDADYVMKNAAGAAAAKIPKGIYDWIDKKIPDTIGGSSGPGGSTQDPGKGGDNRAIGERMLKASGVPGSFSSLNSLWTKESNWDHKAQNPTSTAFGIPQFLDATWQQYGGKETEPTPQIDKGLQYIRDRYGGTDAAWQHSQANNWYSAGGMTNGAQRAVIGEAGRELVIPLENRAAIQASRNAMGTTEISERLESLERAVRANKIVELGDTTRQDIVIGTKNRVREATTGRAGLAMHESNRAQSDKRVILGGKK